MTPTRLSARGLTAGYRDRAVLDNIDLEVKPAGITAIVGANACGKSTLLRSLSRLLAPLRGQVLLDGHDLHRLPARRLAQRLGLLPQAPLAPEGITVLELVSRGRHPHQGMFQRWSREDDDAVSEALEATDTTGLAERVLEELSGGQRQRVWIAMALAQRTEVLLLDEPTTYLDIHHQVEVLDLLEDLNRQRGTTIVMVLHELNLAARYADELIAMAAGKVYSSGPASEVMTTTMVREVFGLDSHVFADPVSGRPMMVPLGRQDRRPHSQARAVHKDRRSTVPDTEASSS
ncbi:ABC transporter ATP-binding protein [Halomonas sp. YLB-10]|uniref:ABC transporter ATP-binding protein n=1 Tax=Halomonas sp. YLB-10 TaxID=2483111 RepID=UPI000F5F828D|nr:ABC transporter ATP-binding protein [Halomonas sp. YLB-10]RQW72480.1 ABC transporter ATP-binding protein [Halomonas sp. YLB-10]